MKVAHSCLILWDPMDYSLPGSSVHGIFQTRILEWGAMSLSRATSRPRDRTQVSHIAGRFFTIWATREPPHSTAIVNLLSICIDFSVLDINYGGGGLVARSCLALATLWTVARRAPLSVTLTINGPIFVWLSICLLSLGAMFQGSLTCVVAVLTHYPWIILHCVDRPDFVYLSFVYSSSVDGHLGRLHLLTIVNSAAVNNLCTSFCMNTFPVF